MAPLYGNHIPAPPTLPPTAILCPRHLLIHLFLRLEITENPQSVIMHGSQETQLEFENGSEFESESCSVMPNSVTLWTIRGILQARILEWAAFPFSGGSSQPRGQTQVSRTTGEFFTS